MKVILFVLFALFYGSISVPVSCSGQGAVTALTAHSLCIDSSPALYCTSGCGKDNFVDLSDYTSLVGLYKNNVCSPKKSDNCPCSAIV